MEQQITITLKQNQAVMLLRVLDDAAKRESDARLSLVNMMRQQIAREFAGNLNAE